MTIGETTKNIAVSTKWETLHMIMLGAGGAFLPQTAGRETGDADDRGSALRGEGNYARRISDVRTRWLHVKESKGIIKMNWFDLFTYPFGWEVQAIRELRCRSIAAIIITMSPFAL